MSTQNQTKTGNNPDSFVNDELHQTFNRCPEHWMGLIGNQRREMAAASEIAIRLLMKLLGLNSKLH